jgi:rubrerythrin
LYEQKSTLKLAHKALIDLLQRAYSAEKAAAFAYQGHAGSVKDKDQKTAIRQIEIDEWNHRREVLSIMRCYDIPVSKFYEMKFHIIGKTISFSCYVIGWFMPFYFAGRLESGNVCEYFRMMHFFHELGIRDHDKILYEMGVKEKEHEDYFLSKIKNHKLLPFFEKIFSWGDKSFNDVDLEKKYTVETSDAYCKNIKETNLQKQKSTVEQ